MMMKKEGINNQYVNMGKKNRKPKVNYVQCDSVKADQVIKIKDEEVKITDVIQMKAKRGGFKYRLVGINTKTGKEFKKVNPADRKFVLISGDASNLVIEKVVEEEDTGSKKKTAADFDMASGAAGAALTVPIRAGEVKKGTHVMLKGHPCKTVEVSISKTGKHGHAKANITGIDVFTGKKYVEISPTSHNMTSPVMFRSEWMVTDIAMPAGGLTLMDQAGTQREDLDLPRDTTGNLTDLSLDLVKKFENTPDGKACFVVVLKAMATEQVIDVMVKEASS
eukprot:g1525.t1